ncbi:MAG TPA: CPBP family intramembrane glutamic endopeptidase [Nocardioidaceae bacterium]|jgi:membrane protease YdiL (CAAX protease family)|nr:CPBP family intramembrane glutamic endopeptidase [Nocardioidaceae bacterium]
MTDTTHSTPHTIQSDRLHDAEVSQYSALRVLAVWAAAALPMAVLAWRVAPWLAGVLDGPTALSRALILSITAGMFWQLVLVLVLVGREQGTLRWSVLKSALWLRAPQSPRTGRRGGRLWWVLVPLMVLFAAEEFLPILPTPATRDLGLFLGSHAGQQFLSGNWLWLAICVVMFALNTALGEELLFRGLLLPRMQGAFGRWDWVANGVLFAVYHLHVPWVIPQTLLVDTFVLGYSSRRYRSALIGIAVHSAQSVFFTILVLGLVLK